MIKFKVRRNFMYPPSSSTDHPWWTIILLLLDLLEQKTTCCLCQGTLAPLCLKSRLTFPYYFWWRFWSIDNHRNLSSSTSVAQIHSCFGPWRINAFLITVKILEVHKLICVGNSHKGKKCFRIQELINSSLKTFLKIKVSNTNPV